METSIQPPFQDAFPHREKGNWQLEEDMSSSSLRGENLSILSMEGDDPTEGRKLMIQKQRWQLPNDTLASVTGAGVLPVCADTPGLRKSMGCPVILVRGPRERCGARSRWEKDWRGCVILSWLRLLFLCELRRKAMNWEQRQDMGSWGLEGGKCEWVISESGWRWSGEML